MRPLLLAYILTFSQIPVPTNLIVSDAPFTHNATVRIKPDAACVKIYETAADFRTAEEIQRLKTCVASKVETGTINEIAYEFYYSDGSGSFTGAVGNALSYPGKFEDNWSVACEKDAITDEKSCHMDRGDVRVWVDSRGRSELYIGSNHYPRSMVVIRIDKGAPIAINSKTFNGSFGFRLSPAIIKSISTAKTVTTRYQKWPYTDYQDSSWEPYGFNEALQYIRWAAVRIK